MSNSFPSFDKTQGAFPLPSVAEDTLDYAIHFPYASGSSSAGVPPDPAAAATLITSHVESLLPTPWLWNKDAWELKPAQAPSSASVIAPSNKGKGKETAAVKLEGRMRVGDSVDDEWLVVWLLREISRKWPELVISVRDTDGEFLLIEAANELPSWLSPENAENRLWLAGGHLHLLTLSVRSSTSGLPRQILDEDEQRRQFDPENWVSEEDAIAAVQTGKYRAENNLEEAIWDRISQYPSAMKDHLHRTKAYLPVQIAKALSQWPALVQRAVEGFYVRDPAQLRAAAKMSHFPPSPAVLTSVLLTRPAYAQLQGQQFHAPRVFGPEWHPREEDKDELRWRDIGVKIATGFEIMMREGGRRGRTVELGLAPTRIQLNSQAASTDDSARSDPAYEKYLSMLTSAGFFGSEMKGSEKWKSREAQALQGWKSAWAEDTTQQRPSFAYLVDKATEEAANVPVESLTAQTADPEDSDSWLEVDPDELDGMMQRISGQADKASQQAPASGSVPPVELGEEHGQALQDLAKKVKDFVGGQGDVEGATFADELSDDDMLGSDSESEGDEDQMMTEERKKEIQDGLVPKLPDAEWGRKTDRESGGPAPPTKGKGRAEPKASNADVAPKMRPPLFAKDDFDGVVDESESEDEDDADLPPAGTLGRKIAQMRWDLDGQATKIEELRDGDEDEDEDEDDRSRKARLGWEDDFDEKMLRKVAADQGHGDKQIGSGRPADNEDGDDIMEVDPDMEAEFEGFLKFSREALGISDEMWAGIVKDRQGRGAFVPEYKQKTEPERKSKVKFASGAGVSRLPTQKEAPAAPAPASERKEGEPDMSLNSFDKVMAAMDKELARAKGSQPKSQRSEPPPINARAASPAGGASSGKGKKSTASANPLPPLPTEADLDALSESDLQAMDRELRAALKSAGIEDDSDSDDAELGEDEPEEARMLAGESKEEYRMMRDFLESLKSQGGQPGAVGNLFGRLGQP